MTALEFQPLDSILIETEPEDCALMDAPLARLTIEGSLNGMLDEDGSAVELDQLYEATVTLVTSSDELRTLARDLLQAADILDATRASA